MNASHRVPLLAGQCVVVVVGGVVKQEALDGMANILFGVACWGSGQPSLGLMVCGPAPFLHPRYLTLGLAVSAGFSPFHLVPGLWC